MDNMQKRLAFVMAIAAVILAGSLFNYWQKQTTPTVVSSDGGTQKVASAGTGTGSTLVIYVSGAVNNPGVLKVPAGSRTLDAINSAGGLAPGADIAKVNMAQSLKDGMHIHVPVIAGTGGRNTGTGNTPAQTGGKINVNTADKAELDKLPGIGPSLAERIIEYRQTSGGFKSLEELKKVPGIGDAKWNQLKDKITL